MRGLNLIERCFPIQVFVANLARSWLPPGGAIARDIEAGCLGLKLDVTRATELVAESNTVIEYPNAKVKCVTVGRRFQRREQFVVAISDEASFAPRLLPGGIDG
mgnify:CR=1 FL=1